MLEEEFPGQNIMLSGDRKYKNIHLLSISQRMIIYQIIDCRTENAYKMKKSVFTKEKLNQSSISEAMGAKIDITGPGTGMYMVLGDTVSPESLIIKNGGEIALKISTFIYLATMPFESYLELKGLREIRKIGPVTIDIEKFNRALKKITGNQV